MLVTGGTGFLGKRLAHRLKNMGHNVTVLGRNEEIGAALEQEGITFLKVDLADNEKVINACAEVDYVFHCGALSSPWGRYEDFYNSNVVGTRNIIEGCKKHGIKRLIHVSTPSIYFEFKDKYNVSEDAELPEKKINNYAETKFLAEQEIDRAFEEGLPVVTIRPSGIFGIGDTSILPRLIKANNKKFIPVIANKKVEIDITYVENVVDALLLCKDAPETVLGKKYNITNGEPVSLYDFLEMLILKLGYDFKPLKLPFKLVYSAAGCLELLSKTFGGHKEPVLTKYSVGILNYSRTLDISAARTELGYSPRVSIQDAVEELVNGWNDNYGS